MGTYKELNVFKKGFNQAVDIHRLTKRFPKEEQYSLIDQIRRSSRSVCVNIAEGFRKIRYRAHFVAKMTDADMENTETQIWIDFSLAFGYITEAEHLELYRKSEEVGRMLNHIIEHPEKYGA
jgi:four helix bundle protein